MTTFIGQTFQDFLNESYVFNKELSVTVAAIILTVVMSRTFR